MNSVRLGLIVLVFLIPFVAVAGPFDYEFPYEEAQVVSLIFSLMSLALLLVIDILFVLIRQGLSKKWAWKRFFRFNGLYVLIISGLIFGIQYFKASIEDGYRRNALRAGQAIIDKYRLDDVHLHGSYDGHYYNTKSVYYHRVVLRYEMDSIPNQVIREIESVPYLIAVHGGIELIW